MCVHGNETALNMEQSLQLVQIMDVQGMFTCKYGHTHTHTHTTDPNVEVIYISPVEIVPEVMDYYTRLLPMHGSFW